MIVVIFILPMLQLIIEKMIDLTKPKLILSNGWPGSPGASDAKRRKHKHAICCPHPSSHGQWDEKQIVVYT